MRKIIGTIFFTLCLAVAMMFGIELSSVKAYALEVGDILIHPEEGWQRFDDSDSRLFYQSWVTYSKFNNNEAYCNTLSGPMALDEPYPLTIKFKGTKFRIIGVRSDNTEIYPGTNKIRVTIDNSIVEYYSGNGLLSYLTLLYEKNNLSNTEHTVVIQNIDKGYLWFDAIDIDKDGELLDANPIKVSDITLDKTDLTMNINTTENLTASVLPEDAENKNITWTSSDDKVCTVDENGKVTAVSTGTAVVTATAKDGSGKSASCNVTVVDNSRAILTINMNNGKTYSYDLTMTDINAFDTWYMNRSNGQGSIFYKLNLDNGDVHTMNYTNISDYIVHKYQK